MRQQDINCTLGSRGIPRILVAVLVAALCISCGGDQSAETDRTQPAQTGTASQMQTDTTRTPQPLPEWTISMRHWPDTVHWTIDSSFAHSVDDLVIQLRIKVTQDVSGMRFQNEKPVIPEILMTMTPVTDWRYAKGLTIDSLVLFDPLQKRRFKRLQILSFERAYEDETVRTQYYANLGDTYRISPTLEDGQLLNSTLFMTWDKRTIIAELPPIPLTFVFDPMRGREIEEPPPDYRMTPGG